MKQSNTSTSQLRQRLLGYFDAHVKEICAWQNEDGSFGTNRELNDQYAFAPLALLYKYTDSQYHQSQKLRQTIQRGMDHLLNCRDRQGRYEFFGHDGISHGWCYYEWVTFYWQETLFLLRDVVEESWWQKHAGAIQHTLNGHFEKLQNYWQHIDGEFKADSDVANLPVWNALLIYRSAKLWQKQSWQKLTQEVLDAVVAAQHPDGWWYESGPVNIYSMVTAQAVSLYYEFSSNAQAFEAVARALKYHATFSYPNGTAIETIDGRMPYHENVPMMLPPTFSRFAQGGAYLHKVIDHLPAKLEKLQGISMMAGCLAYIQDKPTEPAIKDFVLNAPRQLVPGMPAAVVRKNGFCISACGYETVANPSNWRLDRQNLVSLWHEKTGLVVGGGNSKLQPAFSCFNVNDRHGQVHYLHSDPDIKLDGDKIILSMRYGAIPVSIEIEILNKNSARLIFACEDNPALENSASHVEAHLILRPAVGKLVKGDNQQQVLDESSLWWTSEEFGRAISHNGWTLSLPDEPRINMQWPVRPFNPYRPDRKSSLEKAAMIVTVPLTADQPRGVFKIQID